MNDIKIIKKLNSIEELSESGYVVFNQSEIIVNNLQEILNEKQISPADLSKMTGIQRQNINSIIKGTMKPGIDFALKMAYVLNKHVEEIFELTDDAWLQIVKNTDESTLYLNNADLTIIDGKAKSTLVKADHLEYYDSATKRELTKEEYMNELDEYIYDHLYITVEEISENIVSNKKVSERELEAMAKKKLTKDFQKSYIPKYSKLAKRIKPLVNKH